MNIKRKSVPSNIFFNKTWHMCEFCDKAIIWDDELDAPFLKYVHQDGKQHCDPYCDPARIALPRRNHAPVSQT
jgi:hypothetical protein